MSVRKNNLRKKRRFLRVKNKLKSGENPIRVSVFKSNKNFYAQVIDDSQGKTIVSSSNVILDKVKGDKTAVAKEVGIDLAKKCVKKGVLSMKFDRGPFLFHGRVKAFAQGLSEGGLKI